MKNFVSCLLILLVLKLSFASSLLKTKNKSSTHKKKFFDKIKNAVNKVVDKTKDAANSVVDKTKDILNIDTDKKQKDPAPTKEQCDQVKQAVETNFRIETTLKELEKEMTERKENLKERTKINFKVNNTYSKIPFNETEGSDYNDFLAKQQEKYESGYYQTTYETLSKDLKNQPPIDKKMQEKCKVDNNVVKSEAKKSSWWDKLVNHATNAAGAAGKAVSDTAKKAKDGLNDLISFAEKKNLRKEMKQMSPEELHKAYTSLLERSNKLLGY